MKTQSQFRAFIAANLSTAEFRALTLLYQPLIGSSSFTLYQTLYQLAKANKEYVLHQTLFDILNIKRNAFVKDREKLEAVGLLETYESDDEYIYYLKKPFVAKTFLLDTILGTFLESEIGEENLAFLAEIFKVDKPVLNHFKNISKSFDDLYEFKNLKLLKVDYELEGNNGNNNKLIRKTIDYETFVEQIPRAYKGTNLLNDKFREQVIQLSYVYNFNVDQMLEVYKNAHKGRNSVTINQLNLQAKTLYDKENMQIIVSEKEDDETKYLQNVSPEAIVKKFVKPNFRGAALSTINEFILRNDIDQGIVNVLVMFISKNKDGILPNVNYLDKVWGSWVTNGVQTVEDAINHRNNIEKKWQANKGYQSRSKNNKVEVDRPEWLDEYLDEISKMEG